MVNWLKQKLNRLKHWSTINANLIKMSFIFEKKIHTQPVNHCHITASASYSTIPKQDLSVVYGGSTFNYGKQLSLYILLMPRVNMTRDLAHLLLSDL